MLEHYTTTAATINKDRDIVFPFHPVDIGKLDTGQSFWQNPYSLFPFDFINYQSRGIKKRGTPEPSGQNTSTARELDFAKEIESGTTQELVDSQEEQFNFLSYSEDDLLDWDAAIITPPPRPSRKVRVKLKFKGRSKPFPIENFWEE